MKTIMSFSVRRRDDLANRCDRKVHGCVLTKYGPNRYYSDVSVKDR